MHLRWDASLIADTVHKYVVDYNISIVRALFDPDALSLISRPCRP